MTVTRESQNRGAETINDLFAWYTAEINYLDESIARQRTLAQDTTIAARVRHRIQEAFTTEVEALKHDFGLTRAELISD
jgi:hypothetical protein